MNEMQAVDAHYVWSLSAPVLILYVAAAAIFVFVLGSNVKTAEGLTDRYASRSLCALGAVALIALASNFIAAATVALLGRMAAAPTRLSMILLPLLLLAERHGRGALTVPRERDAHLWGFLGGAAGMLTGAFLFLRSDLAQDTVAHVVVPGTVSTLPLSEVVRNPSDWAISIQLVVFYCVSLAIFFAIHHLLDRMRRSRAAALKQGDKRAVSTAGLSAAALNFLGVALLVLLGSAANVQIRLAMVILPFFLITESYVNGMRADAEGRRSYWPGFAGSLAGMAAAGFLLLRGAPFH